nr:unnamed protein product [Callosobruchus chinensis]
MPLRFLDNEQHQYKSERYLCVDNKMEHRVSSSQLNALLDILQENPDVGARRWHWSEIKRGDRPKVARNC